MDRLKVLIVDDSITVRKLYHSLLSNNPDIPIETLQAQDANSGIDLCNNHEISCILLDYNLPDMNGLEFVNVIKRTHKNRIPIIMLTGEGNEQIAVKAIKQGVDDYIPKNNVNEHTLITSIMHVINKKKLEAQENINRELENQKKIAQEESRLKNQLLQNMSHELRTPLNGIIGYADLIFNEDMGPLNQEQKSACSDILKSSNHLLQIVNNVIKLTEISSGNIKLDPQQIEISSCINQAINHLSAVIKEKDINIQVNINDNTKQVSLDADFLEQIISNYLANALEFSLKASDIKINVRPESSTHFRIEVIDKGYGIKQEEISKLFIPFQLLDPSVTRTHQGVGLGLALNKHMAEALGGTVGVTSVLQTGSTFYVILPKMIQPKT